jgi:hypothetical protein
MALNKGTPAQRVVEPRSADGSHLVCEAPLGGLHHRYDWSEAASLVQVPLESAYLSNIRSDRSAARFRVPQLTTSVFMTGTLLSNLPDENGCVI